MLATKRQRLAVGVRGERAVADRAGRLAQERDDTASLHVIGNLFPRQFTKSGNDGGTGQSGLIRPSNQESSSPIRSANHSGWSPPQQTVHAVLGR